MCMVCVHIHCKKIFFYFKVIHVHICIVFPILINHSSKQDYSIMPEIVLNESVVGDGAV